MSEPKRIQRRRSKGWKMPPNTVSVTRPGKWGNPFYPGSGMAYGYFDAGMNPCTDDVRQPSVQVAWFRQRMSDIKQSQPQRFEAYIAPLRGKNLACWCDLDAPCHADVLLELANK